MVGPACFPTGRLADVPIEPIAETVNEIAQRQHLLVPLQAGAPIEPISFRRPRLTEAFERWLEAFGEKPLAVVNPGGRLDYRRLKPQVFAPVGRRSAVQGQGRLADYYLGPR